MILRRPEYQIMQEVDGLRLLQSIERCGRTCYKSEDRITEDSAIRFVQMLLRRGHESAIEHEMITVLFICDRGISHEIVRHRIASYSQESTRYCDYSGQHITYVIPPWVQIEPGTYTRYDPDLPTFQSLLDETWFRAMMQSELDYNHLRALGWKPERARSVLPNSLKTEIVCTYNLREWRHFFRLRTPKDCHPQMRELTIPLLKEFQEKIPVLFDEFEIPEEAE